MSIAYLVITATLSILFSSSAFAYGGLISNGNFENGHSIWTEQEKISGSWYSSSSVIYSTGGWNMTGNFEGFLFGTGVGSGSALTSNTFYVPYTANKVTLNFDSKTTMSGSCPTSSNYSIVGLYDHNASTSIDIAEIFVATRPTTQGVVLSNIISLGNDLSTRSGHQYSITFMSETADTSCTISTYIDNVVVNPGSAVYRMANWMTHERLFTSDWSEVQNIKDKNGWVHEGTSFYAAPTGTAVYRLANWKTHERLFTTDWNEVQSINNLNGWVYENIAFYAESSGTAVYRLANWKTHERLFSTDWNEVVSIMNKNGWVYENLSFYAY